MAVRISEADFKEKVLDEALPVLVDFYSDSCIVCKKLAPTLGDLEDNYDGKIKVYKVNSNFDIEVAEKYNVLSNPTLLLFKGGQESDRKIGAKTYDELAAWIDENI